MHKAKYLIVALLLTICAGSVWYSSSCHHRIHCLSHKDVWFAKRYRPNIPLFFSGANASSVLSYIPDEQARSGVAQGIDVLAERAQKTSSYVPALSSCAVVGSSPNLLQSNYGAAIDAHDVVFRINSAPTQRYENDVGKRTTYNVIHSGFTHIRDYGPQTVTLLTVGIYGSAFRNPAYRTKRDMDTAYTLQNSMAKFVPGVLEPLRHAGKGFFNNEGPTNLDELQGGVLIMHNNFLYYINNVWFNPPHRQPMQWASTGLKGLFMALYMCDKVDVYGFGGTNEKGRWEHYFGGKTHSTGAHRADFQNRLLKQMEAHNIITIYTGTGKKDAPGAFKPKK